MATSGWWYVSVMSTKEKKVIFGPKQCLNVNEANKLRDEKKLEYPLPDYQVYRENY